MKLTRVIFENTTYFSSSMPFIYLVFSLFFLISTNNFANSTDSSLIITNEKPNDKSKISLLHEVAENYIYTQPDSALKAAYIAQHLSDSMAFDSLHFRSNLLLADIYFNIGDVSRAFTYINAAEHIGIRQNKISWINECNAGFGDLFFAIDELIIARKFYELALGVPDEKNITFLLKYGLTFKSRPTDPILDFNLNNLTSTIKSLNNPDLLARANHLQGIYAVNNGEFSNAIKYFNNATKSIETNSPYTISYKPYYDDLAIAYSLLNKHKLARRTIQSKLNPNATKPFIIHFIYLSKYIDSLKLDSLSIKPKLISIGKSQSLDQLIQLYKEINTTYETNCDTQNNLLSRVEQLSNYLYQLNKTQTTIRFQLQHQLEIKELYSDNRVTLKLVNQEKVNWIMFTLGLIILLTIILIGNYYYPFIHGGFKVFSTFILSVLLTFTGYLYTLLEFGAYLELHTFRHYGLIISLIILAYWIFIGLKNISGKKH